MTNLEGFKIDQLGIVFCDDDYLLSLNRTHLDHDYYTDILTYQYHEEQDQLISGDIMISVDRALDNAKEYGVSPKEEICRLVIHGLLHLMGYNDLTASEKAEMRKKEDYYLPVFIDVPRGTFSKDYDS